MIAPPTTPPQGPDALLDEVLAAYLRAVREGAAPDRSDLLARHPELADDLREFFADQDRFDRLAAPLRAAVGPSACPVRLPAEVGPYSVLGEIARGGMGVVVRARHRTLNRVVALKLLLAGSFASADDVARFRREASAVASLDHPHIVPIYEVGEAPTGAGEACPYFAMKLLDGSLAGAVAAGEWGPGAPSVPRRAATLLSAVARAVHHAHQRGVLHRDLKPANILLQLTPGADHHLHHGANDTDPGTRTVRDAQPPSTAPAAGPIPHVSDFGLARRTDPGPGLGDLTQSGAIVGTPAYMAPEQASGRTREVTVASDVYGLGAVLYELLTGRPPFRGETPLETIRKVLDTPAPPPRSLSPQVDADLETICLKCLQKQPAQRYASAADLADDLDRYLAGQSIHARPVGAARRAWRWARRQPVVAGLSSALLLSLVGGLVAVVLLWQSALAAEAQARQQRDEAQQALAQAEEARRQASAAQGQADASFREAHGAVNAVARLLEQSGQSAPLLPFQRQLMQTVRAYSESFVRQRGGDPRLRRELADTHFSLAQISSRLGDSAAARAGYQAALALYRQLAADAPGAPGAPGAPEAQKKVAGALLNLATHQDLGDSLATSAEALALFDRLLAEHPDDLELVGSRALVLSNRASSLLRAGDLVQGRGLLEEAAAQQEELARRQPWNGSVVSELGSTMQNLGVLMERLGEVPEALCCQLRRQALRQRLADRFPDDDRAQADLAAAHHAVGQALRNLGEENAAIEALGEALSRRRELAQQHPHITRYQDDLAHSLTNLGIWHARGGRRERALAAYEQARDIHERLVDRHPTSLDLRKSLAEDWFNISVSHGGMKNRVAEGDALRRSRQLHEELVKASPGHHEYRTGLSKVLNNLGHNLWLRKQETECKEVMRQAIASTKLLLARAPDVPYYRTLMNSHYGMLAEIEWRQGHADASVGYALLRQDLWRGRSGRQLFLAGVEIARAASLLGGDPEAMPPAARRQFDRYRGLAVAALREAVNAGFRDAAALRDEKELSPLRDRADFQDLLRALPEAPPPPTARR